jgi:hypothetical protein
VDPVPDQLALLLNHDIKFKLTLNRQIVCILCYEDIREGANELQDVVTRGTPVLADQ